MRQIARETFSSKTTIQQNLTRFGIPLREAHIPHGRAPQAKYGTQKNQGRIVRHLGEERVIKTVKDLKSQGLTLRQIAQFLNNIGVPTKCRGKGWQPEMVRRLLSSSSQC